MPKAKPAPRPSSGWTCPACGRLFRHQNQGHTCVPVMSLEERLASLTPLQREICETLLERLPLIGDVHVEPVGVGFFLKNGPTFASLRMRQKGMRLGIVLPRRLDHPRLSTSRSNQSPGRIFHTTTLTSAADVDDDVMSWLAESYASREL